MKFCVSIVVALLASTSDAFSIPKGSTSNPRTGASSSLKFVPTDLSTESSVDSKLGASSLSPLDVQKKGELANIGSTWERFSNWITSTENRLYVGWFGSIMFPTLLAATTCYITAFIAAPRKLNCVRCILI